MNQEYVSIFLHSQKLEESIKVFSFRPGTKYDQCPNKLVPDEAAAAVQVLFE